MGLDVPIPREMGHRVKAALRTSRSPASGRFVLGEDDEKICFDILVSGFGGLLPFPDLSQGLRSRDGAADGDSLVLCMGPRSEPSGGGYAELPKPRASRGYRLEQLRLRTTDN